MIQQPVPGARQDKLAQLRTDTFEVVVIGGGITGAGIARDAAMRGLRTALLERRDFASGTSSKSARQIHGGLRYIESRQLGLVVEACAERRQLLNIAPPWVTPLPFTLPMYEGQMRPLELQLGMWLYDALARFQNVRRHRMISRDELATIEPAISQEQLAGAARYYEGVGDDARLTLATILSAQRYGAIAVNYAQVEALLKAKGRVAGLAVKDEMTGEGFEVKARVVVNATGAWNDSIHKMNQASGAFRVCPNKGIHIIVPRARLGINDAVAFKATDGRRDMYVTPWQHTCLIGTTDADYMDDPDTVYASGDEVRYVLDSTRRTFPAAKLTTEDILSTYAGLRPLVVEAQASAYRTAREYKVSISESGLISIAGGKLTTHRRMAKEVVDRVARQLAGQGARRRDLACRTDRAPLDEALAVFEGYTGMAAELGPEVTAHLLSAYGSRSQGVMALAMADSHLKQRIVPGLPYIYAEVAYGIEHEMALTLSDVMVRRMHIIHEDKHQGLECAGVVARVMSASLGWSRETTSAQVTAYEREVALSRRYRDE